jgi:hypothetical protein
MGQCYLKLYDGFDYSGHLATFTESAYNGNTNSNDRDASGTVTGDCKNTTWLGFEDPGEGGHAWIMGEGGSLSNFRDAHDKCNVKDRPIWKFHDKNNSIKRIDIPTQNINEGRMRQDITIYAKRRDTRQCQWATYPKVTKTSDGKYNAADDDQWLVGHNDKKGKVCPGGEAFWKGYRKVACIYDVKSGSGLGRIRELHGEIKNSFSGDPRKVMFENIASDYCDRADRLEDRVTSGGGDGSTCRAFSNAKALAKEYCKNGDKIATDNTFCTKEELGTALYKELAGKYCEANPDKDFCGCYNVVTNKCLTEENKDLPGCKVTYPTRESINKMPAEYSSNFEGTDKCWGNVCQPISGKYVPEGTIDALCNKTVAVCIADLNVGDLQESGVKIEQNCGSNNQTTDGSSGEPSEPSDGSTEGTPAPMPDSTTTPLETTTTSTSPSLNEDEEEKAFYEKPEVQIGTVASSLVSIFSCFMLIILAM